jgi:hypothetical protein
MGKGQFGLIFFAQSSASGFVLKASTTVGNKFVSIHVLIILQKEDKVKPLAGLLVKLSAY